MSDNKIIKEWLRISHNDLISAQHLFNDLYPKQTEIACYHSQQCAEKALKGYLISLDIEPPYTHNLIELCQMCIIHESSFLDILDQCSDLNPYGVAVKYPNELAVDEIVAKKALADAKIVYDFTISKIV